MRETNFKQTVIGLIPEDWEVRTLAECGTFTAGSGFPMKYQGGTKGKYPFYKVSDMNLEGNKIKMLASNNYLTQEVWNMFKPTIIPSNSIIFAKIGAAIYLERKRLTTVDCCIDNNMQAFVCNGDLDEKYALYVLLLTPFSDISSATALPALKTSDLKKIAIRIPSKIEQKKISDVLSNIDNLIVDLRKLVDKKRAIKAGAMSNLLSGRVRLPGFTEPWRRVLLNDVSEFASVTMPCDVFKDSDYVCTENMKSNLGGISEYRDIIPFIYSKSYVPYDILLSNIRPYLKKIWIADRSGCCSNDVLIIRSNFDLVHPHFLYYCLSKDSFFNYVMEGVTGTKMPRGDKKHIAKYEFSLPINIVEQRAIAKILTDMDDEIAALEAKLKKYEQLKQGMMQQLLTGKIRLVSPNESMS